MFSGLSEQFLPVYYISEFVLVDLAEVTPSIIANFFTEKPERWKRFTYWLIQYPTLTDVTVIDKQFYKSDLYNLIYRPYGQHHGLWALIMPHGIPLGHVELVSPKPPKTLQQ